MPGFRYDFDNDISLGLSLPLSIGNEGAFASSKTSIDALKHNLFALLTTNPGERVMQPTLGAGLYSFCFEPLTEDTADTIDMFIRETVNEWHPEVIIDEVEVNFDASLEGVMGQKFSILVRFALESDDRIYETITFDVTP